MQDVKAHTVPQQAWDQFIMSGSARYMLKDFRRGLYGTVGLDTNFFGGDQYNWLMQIELDPQCQTRESFLSFINVQNDPRFLKNFSQITNSEFKTPQDFLDYCYEGRSPEHHHVMGVGDTLVDNDCEEVLENFLQTTQAKIIQDYEIQKSFYIRDRSCIKNIRGTPLDLIQIFAKEDDIWETRCDGNMKYQDDPNPDDLENQVAQNLQMMPTLVLSIFNSFGGFIPDSLSKKLISRIETANWSLTKTPQFGQQLSSLIQTRMRCQSKSEIKIFNHFIKAFDGNLAELLEVENYKKLEELCK